MCDKLKLKFRTQNKINSNNQTKGNNSSPPPTLKRLRANLQSQNKDKKIH